MVVAYVLWLSALLSVLLGGHSGDLHLSVLEERQAWERAILRNGAISGVHCYRGILARAHERGYTYPLAAELASWDLCQFQVSEEVRAVIYQGSEPNDWPPVRPGCKDEEGKIHLLKMDRDVLLRLPKVNESMVDDLVEYLQDHELAELVGLKRIKGWESYDLSEIDELVTLYGEGPININTAPADVISRLGLDRGPTRAMIEYLRGRNGNRGDGDDGFFHGLSEIEPALRDAGYRMRDIEPWVDLVERGVLAVQSNHFRIRCRAIHEETAEQFEIVAVIDARPPTTIVSWEEYVPQ